MRRQGPLTVFHILATALVVVVVNAQLTWWIVYSLRESRVRLRLERSRLGDESALHAERVALALSSARSGLLAALAEGSQPGRDPAPPPFSRWVEEAGPCDAAWRRQAETLAATAPAASACIVAEAPAAWGRGLLATGEQLEVVAAGEQRPPGVEAIAAVPLPPPFSQLEVRPRADAWHEILRSYRRRIVMMVAEGGFFALVLLAFVGLLAKTLRREAELERQHRNFLAAITHELKSPLAAMRLSLETVLRGRADHGASVRFLENALQDTERLQSLVQKVLEVTRYTGTVAGLTLRRSCLSEVVEDGLASFSRRATAAGADLEAEVAADVWAELDEEAFAIVVSNLLENAVKYGGTIPRLRVSLTSSDGRAILDVTDNGRGITAEDLPFIFDRFYRGGDEMTRTTQGTGLGLFLVREIVNAHHGTVEVAATSTAGTTFRVTLDRAQVLEEPP